MAPNSDFYSQIPEVPQSTQFQHDIQILKFIIIARCSAEQIHK